MASTKSATISPVDANGEKVEADRVNIAYLLRRRAAVRPGAVALVCEGERISYGELEERSNRVAAALREAGVAKGDRVGLLLTNCPEFFEIFFACAKVGARMVPINFRLVAAEVAFVLEDSGSGVLFHSAELAETAAGAAGEGVRRIGIGAEYEAFRDGASPDPAPCDADLDDDVAIIYTSGTTGRPKGAVLTHGNLLHTSINQIVDFEVTARDRTLVAAPLYHVGGMLILTLPTLHVGGTVHLHRAFDPAAVLAELAAERIVTVFLAPTMWKMLLERPGLDDLDLSALRLCVSGGESLPVAIIERLLAAFGDGFVEGYGLTEAASCTSVLRSRDLLTKPGSVGLPFVHNAVIVADEDGAPLPPGEIGEILQSGPTVMRGYWRRPDATAEVMRDGWLRTGDLGTFDEDGFLFIVDRAKDMIISGAENVYPAEVEQLLYRHPEIDEVAVIGLADERWGEAVSAVIVRAAGSELTAEAVTEWCRPRIAGYKRPRRVLFADVLPRNPSGKVLKARLRETYAG
jgi:fatty-acyl-CoA synthase